MSFLFSLHPHSKVSNPAATLIIPTWNNKPYLQKCLESLAKHSHYPLQTIVVVNGSNDGTIAWLEQYQKVDFIVIDRNIGICPAVNLARSMVKTPFIIYANDDMYFLPRWDKPLLDHAYTLQKERLFPFFMLSATMIEPYESNNPAVVVADFGRDLNTFKEAQLLASYQDLFREDWYGSTWPPVLLPTPLWDMVGGFSIEFNPGFYSDPDLSMKCWQLKVRYFRGIGNSLVYHFVSKSTRRLRQVFNKDYFLFKWGISSKDFTTYVLPRGQAFTLQGIKNKIPWYVHWKNRFKRSLKSFFIRYPSCLLPQSANKDE